MCVRVYGVAEVRGGRVSQLAATAMIWLSWLTWRKRSARLLAPTRVARVLYPLPPELGGQLGLLVGGFLGGLRLVDGGLLLAARLQPPVAGGGGGGGGGDGQDQVTASTVIAQS